MALYIPAGRRRRRLIVAVVVAVLVGLVAGWALGRATAPTVADRVASVRSQAQAIDGRLQALPNEYDKVLAGDPQYANGGGPADSLVGIVADTRQLADEATWLSPAQQDAVVAAVEDAQTAASRRQSVAQFGDAITNASAAVNQAFGVS